MSGVRMKNEYNPTIKKTNLLPCKGSNGGVSVNVRMSFHRWTKTSRHIATNTSANNNNNHNNKNVVVLCAF